MELRLQPSIESPPGSVGSIAVVAIVGAVGAGTIAGTAIAAVAAIAANFGHGGVEWCLLFDGGSSI